MTRYLKDCSYVPGEILEHRVHRLQGFVIEDDRGPTIKVEVPGLGPDGTDGPGAIKNWPRELVKTVAT